MPKSKKKLPDHIHELERINLARDPKKKPYIVLKCVAPACPYYIAEKLALGKLAKCRRCGDPFIMGKVAALDHKYPHCDDCIKKKVKPEIAALTELIKDI